MNPIVNEYNSLTGETVQREMTTEELAAYEIMIADFNEKKQSAIQKQVQRQQLLERLGITEEEAKLLLS